MPERAFVGRARVCQDSQTWRHWGGKSDSAVVTFQTDQLAPDEVTEHSRTSGKLLGTVGIGILGILAPSPQHARAVSKPYHRVSIGCRYRKRPRGKACAQWARATERRKGWKS